MPTIIQGLFATDNVVSGGRPEDYAELINYLNPNGDAVLFQLMNVKSVKGNKDKGEPDRFLMKRQGKIATDPKIHWWEKDLLSARATAINYGAGYSDSAPAMVVDNYKCFRAGDIVRVVRTNELMSIATTPSSTTVTFARSFASTTAAAIVDNDDLVVVGNVMAQGSTARDFLSVNPEDIYNYWQCFREDYGIANSQVATKVRYTSDQLDMERREHLLIHSYDIEMAMWFGERSEDTSGATPKYSMRGIGRWMSTNATTISDGILTNAVWKSFARQIFRYGNRSKLLIAGETAYSVLTDMFESKSTYQVKSLETKWGFKIEEFQTGFGTLYLKMHPRFSQNSVDSASLYVLDLDNLTYRYSEDDKGSRSLRHVPNSQANDEDSQKGYYLTECSLEVYHEKTHGYLKNVTEYLPA